MADLLQVHPVLGIEWHAPFLEPVSNDAYEREARNLAGGKVPKLLGYVARSPWLTRAFLSSMRLRFSHADLRTIWFVALIASYENACRHCYGTRRAMLRMQGLSDSDIERLEHDLEIVDLGPEGRAALELVRRLARSTPRPARAQADALVAAGMSREVVAEIVAECANWCLGNRIATLLAVPPEEELEKLPTSFLGRILRPVIGRDIKQARVRAAPPPPVRDLSMPYGRVLEPLASTHMCVFFRDQLAGAFASEVLPLRTKALMFGVVARSLGCGRCEAESRRLLGEVGLPQEAIDEALDQLATPACDPLEATLLPFARDTVRFRPAEIQARTRALVEDIGPEKALEAVGTAALANAIVRIAMLEA